MDNALMLRDGLQCCWGSVVAKNDAENLSCCCVAHQHSSLYFALAWLSRALAWYCSPWSLELWPVWSPSVFFVSSITACIFRNN